MAAEELRTEPDEAPGDLIEEKKGVRFRITSRKLFLTYSSCDDLERDALVTGLKGAGVCKAAIGQERHADGKRHYHALIWLPQKDKTDITNPRIFDVGGHHPNIRRVRNDEHTFAYLAKGGDVFYFGDVDIAVQRGRINGFRKFSEDLAAFTRHVRLKSLAEPFPFLVPYQRAGTFSFQEPKKEDRQRCLFVFGTPNTGKTKWFTETMDGKRVYFPLDGDLAYDNYGGERLIIYDDRLPTLPELQAVLNYSANPKPCPGKQRYTGKELPGGQVRFVIVIYNQRKMWEAGCTTDEHCPCPGCTRTIYFDWDLHFDPTPLISNQPRIDFTH